MDDEKVIFPVKTAEFIARDGKAIFYRKWEGQKEKDVILYLHGLESHAGWFIDTGNLLNRKGFHVYAVDRRGSGRNEADRGHMENYWTLIDDVTEAINMTKAEHPDKGIYLMALCWGAKLAVTFVAYHQNLVNGLILLAPGIKTKADLSLKKKIDVAFSNIFMPRKLFDVPLEDSMFTKDPTRLEFIKNDKLKLTKATARFFFETGKMNRHLSGIAHKIQIPLLLFLAGEDLIVDNDRVKKWFARVGSGDKTIRVYHGCSHSLEFEKEIGDIVDYIADWIENRTEK